MYRCNPARTAIVRGAIIAATVFSSLANAQRTFPPDALRGRLIVIEAPVVQLNGQSQRLAPGSRIRNVSNMLEMPVALGQREYIVNYTLDTLGQVKDVWVLSDAERAKRPWPTTLKQAGEWSFDAQTQSWSRP